MSKRAGLVFDYVSFVVLMALILWFVSSVVAEKLAGQPLDYCHGTAAIVYSPGADAFANTMKSVTSTAYDRAMPIERYIEQINKETE